MISISKAEHLPSFSNRGPGELGNGLFVSYGWLLSVTSLNVLMVRAWEKVP